MRGALALVVATLALAGCTASVPETEAARPVSTDESQLLAVARFNNFDAGSRPFSTTVRERGVDLHLQGWVDYSAGLGFAATTGDFPAQALQWTSSEIAIVEAEPDSDGYPVLPMPGLDDPRVSQNQLDPASSSLDTLISVISGLSADRPDNPLLLQQSGALWLREDEVAGTPVTVFAAPAADTPRDASSPPLNADTSPLRLWVNERGLMLRAEVRVGGAWVTVDFPDEAGELLQLPETAP